MFQTRGATALVFRGDDGLDELTTTGHSHIWEVTGGRVTEHDIDPRDLGIPRARVEDLLGGDPEHNAAVVHRLLAGESGPVRDIVLLNAAAGLVAFRLAEDPSEVDRPILQRFREQLVVAAQAIDSGAAARKLADWVATPPPDPGPSPDRVPAPLESVPRPGRGSADVARTAHATHWRRGAGSRNRHRASGRSRQRGTTGRPRRPSRRSS